MVKRTERGWPGHYILAHKCIFRRNTLLEYKDKKIIVSTVGELRMDDKIDSIGANRWYETMVFPAIEIGGYLDADTSYETQLYPDGDWGIWGETWADVLKQYPLPDNVANDMHERIVDEFIQKLKDGVV